MTSASSKSAAMGIRGGGVMQGSLHLLSQPASPETTAARLIPVLCTSWENVTDLDLYFYVTDLDLYFYFMIFYNTLWARSPGS